MISAIQIEKNWQKIKDQINKSQKKMDSVKVIPVTKSVGVDEIKVLMKLGFDHFAENRIDQLIERKTQLSAKNVKWDFIGNIQSRKIQDIVMHAHLIHSASNKDIISKINSCAHKANMVANILIQVNIAAEPQKGGFCLTEIQQLFPTFLKLENIRIKGLMTMAPQTDDIKVIRKTFAGLRDLRDLLKQDAYQDFQELSMGMSEDFEIAIQEGATIIRLGRLFFKEN